jgi:hypothetical protein
MDLVTAQQAMSLSITPLTGPQRGSEYREIGRVASLVGNVVDHLETAGVAVLREVIDECNRTLEAALERHREARDAAEACDAADARAGAGAELTRLARLLEQVGPADAPIVMRMIRRVLGRLDTHD